MQYLHDVEVTPAEIRQAWATIQRGENPFSPRQAGSGTVNRFPDYRATETNAFIGATGAEIQHRLENGYDVEAKDLSVPGGSEDYVMPQVELDEETGDLLIDQALSGEDLYRVQWEETVSPRSLTIRACIGMHAGTDAEVIGAYNEWLLKVIDAAQRRGVAPSVELWIGTRGGLMRNSDAATLRVCIPLVKSGEMVDATAWRAYLTPGAFRSLGFVALALGADKVGKGLNAGMGGPTNKRWGVTLEGDVLDIECPGGDVTFPEELLDRMLEEAGV